MISNLHAEVKVVHGEIMHVFGSQCIVEAYLLCAGYHCWWWCHSPHPQVSHQQGNQEGVGVLQRTHAARHCLLKLLPPYIIQKRCYFNTTMLGVGSSIAAVLVGCSSPRGHADPCESQTTDQACKSNCNLQPVQICQLALRTERSMLHSFCLTAMLHQMETY